MSKKKCILIGKKEKATRGFSESACKTKRKQKEIRRQIREGAQRFLCQRFFFIRKKHRMAHAADAVSLFASRESVGAIVFFKKYAKKMRKEGARDAARGTHAGE